MLMLVVEAEVDVRLSEFGELSHDIPGLGSMVDQPLLLAQVTQVDMRRVRHCHLVQPYYQ